MDKWLTRGWSLSTGDRPQAFDDQWTGDGLITVRKRTTALTATAGVLGGVLALTALGGTSQAATGGNGHGDHPHSQAWEQQAGAQDASDARIKITPGQGASQVGIDDPVKVTVSNGKLTKVAMTAVATGTEIPGTLAADGTSWQPDKPLERATRYQIAAEAADAKGRSATENASITTVSPAGDFIGHVSPRTARPSAWACR